MTIIDTRELRNAFGSFMTGVTVVTAVSDQNEKVGFTANSFTSVSVDPPLLLVCPSNNLSSIDIFNSCKHFAVNILAEDQQDISNTFASAKGDRFEGIKWHNDEHGCPIIDGTVAHFSCSTHNTIPAGDHVLLVGEIKQFDSNENQGLGYARGGYFSLGLEHRAEELTHSLAGVVGGIIEFNNKILLQKTPQGYTLPQVATNTEQGSQKTLRQHLNKQGLTCEIGSVYSIYENLQTQTFTTYYRASAKNEDLNQDGEYIAIDRLDSLEYASSDIQSMLQRYALEKQNGVFRLYVGDEKIGNVQ